MSTGTYNVTVGPWQRTARDRAPTTWSVGCATGGSAMAGASVLVIEEDQAIADVLTDALRHEGYIVSRASSPDDAVALLALRGPGAFDLVLSSPFWTPCEERDRYAGLAELGHRTCAPVMICSRWPAAFYADHRARGGAACLPQPFHLSEMLA